MTDEHDEAAEREIVQYMMGKTPADEHDAECVEHTEAMLVRWRCPLCGVPLVGNGWCPRCGWSEALADARKELAESNAKLAAAMKVVRIAQHAATLFHRPNTSSFVQMDMVSEAVREWEANHGE